MTERFHGIILQAEEISKSYRTAREGRKAGKAKEKENICSSGFDPPRIKEEVGESWERAAVGKSTLLRMLSGLEKAGLRVCDGEKCVRICTDGNQEEMRFSWFSKQSGYGESLIFLLKQFLSEPLKISAAGEGRKLSKRREGHRPRTF